MISEKIDELCKNEQTRKEQYSKYKIQMDADLGMFPSNCLLCLLIHSCATNIFHMLKQSTESLCVVGYGYYNQWVDYTAAGLHGKSLVK